MYPLLIFLLVIDIAIAIVLMAAAICFFKIFFSVRKAPPADNEYPIPEGDIYEPFAEQMISWTKDLRAMKHSDVAIRSYDGLALRGKYYEYKKGAPVEILFHGYRGTAERDLCGGVYRCFELKRNALIVDHRASGFSEGHVITFGIKESRDCVSWINFVIENIDADAQIIITGISMGAATVMTAAGFPLPKNVVGVLADCGYTSTKDIVKKVMRDMKLPANLLYPFARLGAILFGGFDPNERSPIESMSRCTLPVIFFHGDTDAYVPCYMSEENYNACSARHKRLVITPGAGHGLCFPMDTDTYFKEVNDFFAPILSPSKE